jgi:hypothetical protein
MSVASLSPRTTPTELPARTAPEITREALFDRAAEITGSHYTGDPLAEGASPEDIVMGAIFNFSGNDNISAFERGVLLHMVIEMKADGSISKDEAHFFANRVENLTRGFDNFEPR